MMRANFETAEAAYVASAVARQKAVADAYDVGWGDREIGRTLGINAGSVARMRRQAADPKGVARHAATRARRVEKRRDG